MADKRRYKGFDYHARDPKGACNEHPNGCPDESHAPEPEKPVSSRRRPLLAPSPRRTAPRK